MGEMEKSKVAENMLVIKYLNLLQHQHLRVHQGSTTICNINNARM